MMCFRYKRLLIPFSEDVLDERTRAKVERHLGRCGSCRAELACVNTVAGALRETDIPAAEPAPDLWIRVRGQIEEARASRRPGTVSRVPQTVYAFAAVLLVGIIGWGMLRSQMAPQGVQMAKAPVQTEQRTLQEGRASVPAQPEARGAAVLGAKVFDSAVKAKVGEQMARRPQAAVSSPQTSKAYGKRVMIAKAPQGGYAFDLRPTPAAREREAVGERSMTGSESAGAAAKPKEAAAAARALGEMPAVTRSVTTAGTVLEETRSADRLALADRDKSVSKAQCITQQVPLRRGT